MKWIRVATSLISVLLMSAACYAGPSLSETVNPHKMQGSPTWVRYTDNAEGAFSMEVPVGWQVEGGMYRFGYFDVRWMMDIRSLDGKVIIRIDDPNVPPYVLPGPHSGPSGHPAIRPNMYQMVVDNYREAQPYAKSYAKRRFRNVCSSLTSTSSDWTPTMPEAWQLPPGAGKSTEASVAYDCATSDGPRVVNVFARNSVIGNQGLWLVDPIISILATKDRLRLAHSMTQHMIDSWRENPQWKQYQSQLTQIGLTQMREEFGQFMRRMATYHRQREAAMNQQVAQFEARQQAQANQVSSWGNILTGVTNLYDPVTGTKFQVFSGPKANYYMNGAGVKINSNIDPGNGFHQVQNLGP
jgi:BMFP domain-containing protein YqiC